MAKDEYLGTTIVVEDGVKMMKRPDGTLMSMDEFWDYTQKNNISIFTMEPDEMKYLELLSEAEERQYMKDHTEYESGSYVIFVTPE